MTASFTLSSPSMPVRLKQQRILGLSFPHLSTDRIARKRWGPSWRSAGRPEHPPVIIADRQLNAMRLSALDEAAEAFGLKRGQGVAEARAMCPGIDVVAADPQADAAFLSGLADWCDRYTPLVALDGNDGLYLDITGCAHLFGGEKALLADLMTRLFHLGIDVRASISPTPGLSSAAARYGGRLVIDETEVEEVLAALPVAALRLTGETIAALLRVGLKQVGDLLAAPRAPLARRFGAQLLLRIDQALGRDDEPVSPRRPVPMLSAERRLAEPVQAQDSLLLLISALAQSLKAGLEARGEGGRFFELLLFRVDGKVIRLAAGASAPLRDPARISALFAERLTAVHDDLDAGFGFEILRLCVTASEPYSERQADLAGSAEDSQALADFIDRMVARFGADSLQVPVLHQSHVPERASQLQPFEAGLLQAAAAGPSWPQPVRPIRLFAHPEPVEAVAEVPEGPPITFRWRRILHRVARAEGPERISAEWWLDGEEAPTRDYYRIEDQAGHRFWLFRKGLFGRELVSPLWFMHGVFA